jgi:RHS repeat-associated protein
LSFATTHTTNPLYAFSGYRYGFNGQEKDNEVAGSGNSYTAEFWQYDPRLGRRFNIDPKPNPTISVYACFANNPIVFTDPNGDTVKYNSFWDRVRVGIGRVIDRGFNERFKAQKQSDIQYTYKTADNKPNLLSASPDFGRKLSTEEFLNGDWKKYSIEYSLGSFININIFGGERPIDIEVTNMPSEKLKTHTLNRIATNHPIELIPRGHPDIFTITDGNSSNEILGSTPLVQPSGGKVFDNVPSQNHLSGSFFVTISSGTSQLSVTVLSQSRWAFVRPDGTRGISVEKTSEYRIRYWKKTGLSIKF